MKKILILFVVLTALYSCKKSSDPAVGPDPVIPPPTTASLLLGQWKYLKDSTITYTAGTPTIQQTTYTNASILFNSDFSGVDVSTSFFYNLSGNQLALNYPAYQSTSGGVTTTIPEQTYTATITVITATKLTLYYNFTGKDTNGATNGYSIYSIYSK